MIRKRSRPTVSLIEVEDPLAEADALIADGRVLDAIAVLTAANRRQPDGDIETRLVQLRVGAFQPPRPRRRPLARRWPPRTPDLFPDVDGIPEVAREQLDVDTLRSGILHHGSLLVRGLVDGPTVERLRDDIDRAFEGLDAWDSGMPVQETAPWFAPLDLVNAVDRKFAREGGGLLAVESPRAFFDTMQTFEDAGIRRLITEYLTEPPFLLADKWTLRRVRAQGLDPDWHQDGSFMGADVRSLDVWLALSACGDDSPGLDVVPRRFDELVETGTGGACFPWSVGKGTIDRIAQGTVVRPRFEAGDALLFDHMCLHRTGVHPGMTRDRYAIEAWFAAPSAYPPAQKPIPY